MAYLNPSEKLQKYLAVFFFIIAVADFYPFFLLVDLIHPNLIALSLMLIGLYFVYRYNTSMFPILLVSSSVLFNFGLMIFFSTNLHIKSMYNIFPSILFYFVGSASFLIHYYFKPNNRFATLSIAFFTLSVLSIFFRNYTSYQILNEISYYAYTMKSIFFITFAVFLLLKRK